MTGFLRRLGLLLLLSGLVARPVSAQSGIQALRNSASVHFPDDIAFRLQASSASKITTVTLDYGLIGQACNDSQAQQAMTFTASSAVDVTWPLQFASVGTLPPGAQVWWQWDVRDASGADLMTPRQTVTVADDAFNWQTVTRQSVSVTWSQGSQAFGQQLLDRALSSLDRLKTQLGVRPVGPVHLVIYPSADAVRAALVNVPEWTGGIAYPEYNLTVIGIAPGEDTWAATVIPHELAHLVVGTLVFNCHGISLPTWLNEGLAVVAQGPADPHDLASLSVALTSGALPPLSSLANGFQADATQANLSYTRSGEVLRYLIGTYGADHLLTLLQTMQAGNPIDAALGLVYGLDTDGLDAAWRASQGAPVQATVAPVVTQGTPTAVPTLPLWTAVPATALPLPSSSPPAPTPAATSTSVGATAIAAAATVAAPTIAAPTAALTSTVLPPAGAPRAPAFGLGWLWAGAGVLLCGVLIGLAALVFYVLKVKT